MSNKKIKLLPQLNLFEEIVLIEELQPGEQFRADIRGEVVYTVKKQVSGSCKAKGLIFDSHKFYLIPHGRKVFRIITGTSKKH